MNVVGLRWTHGGGNHESSPRRLISPASRRHRLVHRDGKATRSKRRPEKSTSFAEERIA